MLEAEAEENFSRPCARSRTKFWPRGQLVLEDLTSLGTAMAMSVYTVSALWCQLSRVMLFDRTAASALID